MHTNIASAHALTLDVSPVGSGVTSVSLCELAFNRHESFRVDISLRDGKPVIALSRWKHTPAGERRTGQSIAFGAHRLAAVRKLLADAEAGLVHFATDKGAANEAS